jgi:Fasciclin domain
MKNYKILYISLSISILSCLLSSCDLEIQKKNKFVPGIPDLPTFKTETAWEWMQKQTSPAGTVPAANKLDFMIQLIKVAGLEEEYNKPVTERTYLFLNNSAFTGTGRINALLTGVVAGTGDLSKVDKVRAANLLKYHIVNAYVDQINALPIYYAQYEFKTLLDGPNGVISFRRDERYSVTINSSPNLPSTRRSTTVTLHNYQFKNGIAHFISSHVGITNF